MLKLTYIVYSGPNSHPVIHCRLTWQLTINYIHQATPESTPSKKLAILDPPTRRWSYKPFISLTEEKSQNINTRHRIKRIAHFHCSFSPLPPSNLLLTRPLLSTIPPLVDGDSPCWDIYNTSVARHNLCTYIIIYSWIWLMYSLQESDIVYTSICTTVIL